MNYRESKNYENLQRRIFDGVGAYGIPAIEPEHFSGDCNFISFNYAKSTKDGTGKGVHFFVDDYQFNRVWNDIDRYVPMLSRFDWVMSPDFSIYIDFPRAIQIYNHYRKHWVAAYLQEAGIKVIPTITWGLEDSFDFCFDGEPTGGTVATSSIGMMRDKDLRMAFLRGYDRMLELLQPDKIIFYGDVPKECTGNLVRIRPFTDKFKVATVEGW